MSAEESTGPVAFRFVSGNPTPEEVAAVVTVLTAAAREREDRENAERDYRAQERRSLFGVRLRPGFGAWKRTRSLV